MPDESNELAQQIEQRMNELPADIQNAILSSDIENKIIAIGTASKLHLDQIQNLHNITLLSILGFMPLQDLEKEVQNQLEVPADVASKIAENINSQVLLSIRESMKKSAASATVPPAAPAMSSLPKPPLSEVLPKDVAVAPQKAPAAPIPTSSLVTPTSAPAKTASAPLPAVPTVDMHPADIMLTQKTVATPPQATASAASPASVKPSETKAAPPKPADYKADPYREPIN